MTPPPPPKTHVLRLEEWGWRVALAKSEDNVSLEIRTPGGKGYSLLVDAAGNVTEIIQGNYTRVVMGSVREMTMKECVVDSTGPHIVHSSHSYVALTATKVHLNPSELKGAVLPPEFPLALKEI